MPALSKKMQIIGSHIMFYGDTISKSYIYIPMMSSTSDYEFQNRFTRSNYMYLDPKKQNLLVEASLKENSDYQLFNDYDKATILQYQVRSMLNSVPFDPLNWIIRKTCGNHL